MFSLSLFIFEKFLYFIQLCLQCHVTMAVGGLIIQTQFVLLCLYMLNRCEICLVESHLDDVRIVQVFRMGDGSWMSAQGQIFISSLLFSSLLCWDFI